jgi:hypothetical protein
MSGIKDIGSRGLSDRVSYSMDSEVSPPHPESGRPRVFDETFSEGDGDGSRVRDSGNKHTAGTSARCDDHPAEVCGERSDGEDQGSDEQPPSEKVSMVKQSILEGEYRLVAGIFCFNGGHR